MTNGNHAIARLRESLPWKVITTTFGNRHNRAIIEALLGLVKAMDCCATEFKRGKDMSLEKIVDLEHRGDVALKVLNMAAERSFVVRQTLNKADITQLGHELDNVIDGMRGVARHIDIYRRHLPELPGSSLRLFDIVDHCISDLTALVTNLTKPRIDFEAVNQLVGQIIAFEQQADEMRDRALRARVETSGDIVTFAFKALEDLDQLLESITDHAKHCAVKVLSMARQEA